MPDGTLKMLNNMKDKTKVLFVCLGNICRSPMAEGVFTHIVNERGLREKYIIDSAGVAGYHIGELPDRRMREHAWQRGYKLDSRARQVKTDDFFEFDYILAMDDSNYDALISIAPNIQTEHKVKRMADFCRHHNMDHVPDPYYGGADGFQLVIDLLEDACETLLNEIESNKNETL